MIKNVLIPTDFTERSLRAADRLAEAYPRDQFNVVLCHIFHVPDGITELLMLHRSIPVSVLFSDELRAECRRLKQKHGAVLSSIAFKPIYGTGSRLFNDFLSAEGIDTILYDDSYHYTKPHRYSAGMISCFRKAQAAVLKTSELTVAKAPVSFTYVTV